MNDIADITDKIPPEAWPFIDSLFTITLVLTIIWVVLSVFLMWRRRASNLTPVNAASKSKAAQPDFLSVDQKSRQAAIERGEGFDKELERRERSEAGEPKKSALSMSQQIASIITFLMSLFTLATMIYGAIFQVSRMGMLMQEYSSVERIYTIVERHPIAFVFASMVVIFHIYHFVSQRKWKRG